MGVFGAIDMTLVFNDSDKGDAICEQLIDGTIDKFIEEREGNKDFHFGIDSIDGDGDTAYLTITSGRVQHAEWLAEQVRDFLVGKHKEVMVEISADVNTPESLFHWGEGDD